MTTATLEPKNSPSEAAPIVIDLNTEAIQIDPATGLPLLKDAHFNDFKISESLKSRLHTAGFSTPTPVQAKAIPPALEGSDILATASTGHRQDPLVPHPHDRADGCELGTVDQGQAGAHPGTDPAPDA